MKYQHVLLNKKYRFFYIKELVDLLMLVMDSLRLQLHIFLKQNGVNAVFINKEFCMGESGLSF